MRASTALPYRLGLQGLIPAMIARDDKKADPSGRP